MDEMGTPIQADPEAALTQREQKALRLMLAALRKYQTFPHDDPDVDDEGPLDVIREEFDDIGEESLARILAAQSAEIAQLRKDLGEALEVVRKASALTDSIKQNSANIWWVDAHDPEEAVCQVAADISALLSRLAKGEGK